MMVVFITREQAWRLPELSQDLMRQFPEIVSVYHNVNTNLKLMLGKSFRLLAGREYLTDHIGACRFKLSPQSFFQINNSQAEALYDLVKEYNQFYHDFSILREENEALKVFRLTLSQNVGKVVKLAMGLLGIEVPERM